MAEGFSLARARAMAGLKVEPELYEDVDEEYLPARANVIPQNGFWTANNNLGATLQFEPDPTNRQTVLKLPEWGPPEVWTARLGLDFDVNQMTNLDRYSLVAEVQTGVGGGTHEFEVDWIQGVQFTGVMNAISVTARLDVDSNSSPPVTDSITLSVLISRGTSPNPAFLAPTRTLYHGDDLIRIPKFAKTFMPIPEGNFNTRDDILFAAATEYRFFGNNDPTVFPAVSTVAIYTGNNIAARGGRLPIPPYSSFMQKATTPNFGSFAMFELAL